MLAVVVEADMAVVETGAGIIMVLGQIDISMAEIVHDLTEGASNQAFYVMRFMIWMGLICIFIGGVLEIEFEKR